MKLLVAASGVIEADGLHGSIGFDASSSVVRCDIGGRRIDVHLLGPFGQGYTFSLRENDVELLRLDYDWRNGASIYRPRRPDSTRRIGPLLYYGNRRLIAPKGVEAGRTRVDGDEVEAELPDDALPFDAAALALLMAIDTMYFEGIGLFERRG